MKKEIKTIGIISILLIIFTLLGQTFVYAATSVDIKLSKTRIINDNGTYVEKKAYALNTGSNHPIFQIISTDGTSKKTNYLCLNATKGSTWTSESVGTPVTYDSVYDMVKDKNQIQNLVETYSATVGTYYNQLMWLLDNVTIGSSDDATELLAKAGIVYGSTGGTNNIEAYYYDETVNPDSAFSQDGTLHAHLYGNTYTNERGYSYVNDSGEQVDVLLPKELVEVVEQAAIWYFTNYKAEGNSEYNCLTKADAVNPRAWINYTDDPTLTSALWNSALVNDTVTVGGTTINTGKMLQEQASILYNYLVDTASANSDYTPSSEGTLSLKYVGTGTIKLVEEGSNYKIGPLKVTKTGNTTINNVTVTTGTNTNITSNVTLKNSSGTTITKPTAGNEFFVFVPKTSVDSNVKIKVTGTTKSVKKELRVVATTNNANAEQPIVEVTPESKPLSSTITVQVEKQFDLALRKIITGVKTKTGETVSLLNENNLDAKRTVNINTNTIPDTATYKHRKDPIVVEKGNIITYRLYIYNEGEINGYASKIVDQLPAGLELDLWPWEGGMSITSNKGTIYGITAYDPTTNKLELTADKSTAKTINKFNGSTLDSDYIDIECRVTQNPATDGTTKHYLTNIAYIAEGYDTENNKAVTEDRDGKESKTTESPNKTATELNSTNPDSYKGKTSNQSVKNDTNNSYYYEGEQDDDDFEKVVILPKKFDLALRKFITKINNENITDRIPNITNSEKEKLAKGNATYDRGTTLEKTHPKDKKGVDIGDTIVYTIRVYNEGEVHGYASKVTDYLPEGLSLKENSEINTEYAWVADGQKITTNYLSKEYAEQHYELPNVIDQKTGLKTNPNIIYAFDKDTNTLYYKDLLIECVVNQNATSSNLKNIAEITENEDQNGDEVTDTDSTPDNVKNPYNPTNPENGRGEEDDDDFEDLKIKEIDLALRKFISKISKDGDFSKVTTITPSREPDEDTTKLKSGEEKTAKYNHSKEPIKLDVGDYVLYTIRVYNEGEANGYASEIIDYLPTYLDFVDSTDTYISSINSKWTYDAETRKVTTTSEAENAKTKLLAFDSENDNGKGSGLKHVDVQIICKVNKNAPANKKLTNIAEITEYQNNNGKEIEKDRDSEPKNVPDSVLDQETRPDYNGGEDKDKTDEYIPGQQDDDDFEKVIVNEPKVFDLALRKFITDIEGKAVTTRIPQVGYENNKITYTHPKDVVKVAVGNVVTYTLRVYNEGDIPGYAEKVADDIPEYLEYLPDNATNKQYRWKMYDKDGKETDKVSNAVRIVTDYLSKEQSKDNLLNAFNPDEKISDTNPDHADIKVAFKVKDPNSNKIVITNKAQIAEDADENGDEVDDIDSVPDKWNEGEDDQDYENVSVEYFDLALLKYLTKTIVTENGKTTTTKTGNNGSSTDITPKVEIYRKSINTTIVKFEYVIKITNEGDIAGYAKEITDYVPKGLKFYKEDNNGWKDEGNNVISTRLLENTLLQPGESATVKVILRWINGSDNLGLKTNVAEISEDYNEDKVPDRDSTPDNKKPGEDDIDDAPALLTISTGLLEHPIEYAAGALLILFVLGLGIVAIRKYVL